MKRKDILRALEKLGMEIKEGDHTRAFFKYNGKLYTKTRLSQGSGDARAVPQIRQQLRLDEDNFNLLIACPLTREGYIKILKDKKIIT